MFLALAGLLSLVCSSVGHLSLMVCGHMEKKEDNELSLIVSEPSTGYRPLQYVILEEMEKGRNWSYTEVTLQLEQDGYHSLSQHTACQLFIHCNLASITSTLLLRLAHGLTMLGLLSCRFRAINKAIMTSLLPRCCVSICPDAEEFCLSVLTLLWWKSG